MAYWRLFIKLPVGFSQIGQTDNHPLLELSRSLKQKGQMLTLEGILEFLIWQVIRVIHKMKIE